jgi:hypothetical protein
MATTILVSPVNDGSQGGISTERMTAAGRYQPVSADVTLASVTAAAPVYRRNAVEVYRTVTGRDLLTSPAREVRGISKLRAHYHRRYIARNPNGCCGIGGCGVPFSTAELQLGEMA